MNHRKVENIVSNVTAIMSFENLNLTEQDKDNMRRVLTDKATGDEVVAEIIQRYKNSGVSK